jgi:hypothetical protein
MSPPSVNEAQPSYLPSGYQLRRQIVGDDAAHGLSNRAGDQVGAMMLVHTTGRTYREWLLAALVVHVGLGPDGSLTGTEKKPGRRVDLGLPGVQAVYHDGMWAMGDDGVRPVWRTDAAHSITVRTSARSYGIRGPRSIGIGELVRVARSLPLSR